MESVKLEGEIIEQKARNQSLKENQVTIAYEFRTPLSSSLMLLENVVSNFSLNEPAKQVLWLIISQVNMLLCLVNDSLDMQLIEQDKFVPKVEVFSPAETFKFIMNMFVPTLKIQKSNLTFKFVKQLPNSSSLLSSKESTMEMPWRLLGD